MSTLLEMIPDSSTVMLLFVFGLCASIAARTAAYNRRMVSTDLHAPSLTWIAAFVAFVALTLALLAPMTRALWLLSLLPAGMIIHHAMGLWTVRRRHIPRADAPHPDQQALPSLRGAADAMETAREANFGMDILALRYGVPAFLTILLIITLGYAVFFLWPVSGVPPKGSHDGLAAQALSGARYGLAGAYSFVILNLAQRTFRRDLTSGVAAWSAATLALGPILALVTALVWHASIADSNVGFGESVVYFFAGFAPRQMAGVLQESARRLLTSDTQRSASRVTPLSQLRGVTLEVEERLAEEGIVDVATLAMADPFRLMRNTSFDKRQIVAWIDAAIMMITLPAHWQKLENLGFTGAIDLSWAAMTSKDDVTKILGADADIILAAATRLSQDAQVGLIWALYQLRSEDELSAGVPGNVTSRP